MAGVIEYDIPRYGAKRILAKPTGGTGRRRVGFAMTSVAVHVLVLVVALLFPLWHIAAPEFHQLEQTWLVAPPPPAPPPPPPPATSHPARARRPKMVRPALEAKVTLPTSIPRKIARVVSPPELDMGDFSDAVRGRDAIPGGVPGGVPGGQLGGLIGGVLGGVPSAVPPPVEVSEPLPQKPVRVGGDIRPPQQLKYVPPMYPQVAQQSRLGGRVCIDAIIDPNGRVVEMKVLQGHPVLANQAINAVRQWVYEPTYLNGQPIPIAFVIKVNFRL